jgi:tetratricopeptide (TPR) repeat protein
MTNPLDSSQGACTESVEESEEVFVRLLEQGGPDVMTTTFEEGNRADEERRKIMDAASQWSSRASESFARKEYALAVSLSWMSLAIERTLGSPFRQANDYGNIGNGYLALGYVPEAEAAYRESLRLYALGNSAGGAAKAYFGLAQCKIRLQNLPGARELARRSVALFEKHQHEFTIAAQDLLEWINAKESNPSSVMPEVKGRIAPNVPGIFRL